MTMSCYPLQVVSRMVMNRSGEVFYIGGNDVLPAPLEPKREAFILQKLGTGQEEEAKSVLIEHNLRLVVYIAKKFDNTGVGVEDLISIGTIGLIKAINTFKPEVIALNCCAAETKENGRLIMGAEDVWNVSLAAPEAKLYLTHMDNVAHASVTRFTMRGQLTAYGVSNYDMLEDGEAVVY